MKICPRLHVGVFFMLFIPFTAFQIRPAPFNPERVTEWLKAVDAHQPGTADAPAIAISRWQPGELRSLVTNLRGLLETQRVEREKFRQTGVPRPITYRDKVFTLPQLQKLLGLTDDEVMRDDANRVVKRAALLHTDIARHIRAGLSSTSDMGSGVVVLQDGQQIGTQEMSPHWAIARGLLDLVTPSPSTDLTVRQWCHAMAADELARQQWSLAAPNLIYAQLILPDDARILLYSGALHEIYASPDLQNIVRALNAKSPSRVNVGSEQMELAFAERLLRQAVTIDETLAEARLRLGHVLGQMGRHDEAVDEVRRAAAGLTDRQQSYYAALFLGREEAARGRLAEAHLAFRHAGALFPLAQSPLLAESQLARREGDSPRALAALRRLLDLPPGSRLRNDPWWIYESVVGRDADTLMTAFYQPFLAGRPR
jgi:hypothetical protein